MESEDYEDFDVELFKREEEDMRRYAEEQQVLRDRYLYSESEEEVPPLTDTELQLLHQYEKEERDRKKQKKLNQKERGQVKLAERREKERELEEWQRKYGVKSSGSFDKEYSKMIREKIKLSKKPTDDEMQRVYEQEFLPLLKKDAEKELARVKAERKKHKQGIAYGKKDEKKKLKELELEKKKAAEKRLAKAEKKEKKRRVVRAPYVPSPNKLVEQIQLPLSEDEEEIEVIEDELDPELQKKLLAIAKQDVPEFVTPVTTTPPKRKRKKSKDTISLAEFHKTIQKKQEDKIGKPECPTLFSIDIRAKHKPPGLGNGEKLEDDVDFFRLGRVKDWRKKLSDSWKAPFMLDGKKWQTVQHYVEARKFYNHPDFANNFSMDSDSELSRDPVKAKYVGSKTGMYKNKLVRPKNIRMMKGYDYKKSLALATYAKFSQNPHLKILLDDTQEACIYVGKKRAVWLENVRKCMKMLKEKEWEAPEINGTN